MYRLVHCGSHVLKLVSVALWCLQLKYTALPNFEEKYEDFLADAVVLKRRFTEEGKHAKMTWSSSGRMAWALDGVSISCLTVCCHCHASPSSCHEVMWFPSAASGLETSSAASGLETSSAASGLETGLAWECEGQNGHVFTHFMSLGQSGRHAKHLLAHIFLFLRVSDVRAQSSNSCYSSNGGSLSFSACSIISYLCRSG